MGTLGKHESDVFFKLNSIIRKGGCESERKTSKNLEFQDFNIREQYSRPSGCQNKVTKERQRSRASGNKKLSVVSVWKLSCP